MGYDTYFEGKFELNNKLNAELKKRIDWFARTRHCKRACAPYYGKDGLFFPAPDHDCIGASPCVATKDKSVVTDYNTPPEGAPGLWCQWRPTEDGFGIEWDGGEKFYHYVEWLKFIVDNFLKPNGYVLNGSVKFSGEEEDDVGIIHVINNVVAVESLTPDKNTYSSRWS